MGLRKVITFLSIITLIIVTGCASKAPCCGTGFSCEDMQRCYEGAYIDPCHPCLIGEIVPPACPPMSPCCTEFCREPIVCSIDDRNRTIAYLIRNGVKVIHVGETITLSLPSDRVFNGSSPNLNKNYLSVLKAASHLIFCYEKTTVRVSAYTDCTCPACVSDLLTNAQAQSIAKLLWCNGIDARLLVARGFGACSPIASNGNECGRAQNRRIEICFRYIPPFNSGCS